MMTVTRKWGTGPTADDGCYPRPSGAARAVHAGRGLGGNTRAEALTGGCWLRQATDPTTTDNGLVEAEGLKAGDEGDGQGEERQQENSHQGGLRRLQRDAEDQDLNEERG